MGKVKKPSGKSRAEPIKLAPLQQQIEESKQTGHLRPVQKARAKSKRTKDDDSDDESQTARMTSKMSRKILEQAQEMQSDIESDEEDHQLQHKAATSSKFEFLFNRKSR